jgi:catechol 2,3-dioxygenase-like lactoylglutathione lyase family enzyme
MSVKTLDHVNIRTSLPEETFGFYTRLLGLTLEHTPGRKDFSMGGWLCDEARRPVVHVGLADAHPGHGNEGTGARRGGAAIDHVAFECEDYDAMHAQLSQEGRSLRIADIPAIGLRQIFIEDPNGITVELNFRGA